MFERKFNFHVYSNASPSRFISGGGGGTLFCDKRQICEVALVSPALLIKTKSKFSTSTELSSDSKPKQYDLAMKFSQTTWLLSILYKLQRDRVLIFCSN